MLNKKLQADHWNEMCYQLLKLMTKQERGRIVGIKRLYNVLGVTTAQLVLLVIKIQLLSDYNCWRDYADRDEIKDISEKR
ncbi:hypothetical protein Tco_0202362 [Tanacetum coccineum]